MTRICLLLFVGTPRRSRPDESVDRPSVLADTARSTDRSTPRPRLRPRVRSSLARVRATTRSLPSPTSVSSSPPASASANSPPLPRSLRSPTLVARTPLRKSSPPKVSMRVFSSVAPARRLASSPRRVLTRRHPISRHPSQPSPARGRRAVDGSKWMIKKIHVFRWVMIRPPVPSRDRERGTAATRALAKKQPHHPSIRPAAPRRVETRIIARASRRVAHRDSTRRSGRGIGGARRRASSSSSSVRSVGSSRGARARASVRPRGRARIPRGVATVPDAPREASRDRERTVIKASRDRESTLIKASRDPYILRRIKPIRTRDFRTRDTRDSRRSTTSTGVWDETTDRFAPVHDVENTKG